jgi:hypothetical protein
VAYAHIAVLAQDNDFLQRSMACAATEGETSPNSWVSENQWQLAATPGFGDKYASALENEIERPGLDPSVISDEDILSSVQALRTP